MEPVELRSERLILAAPTDADIDEITRYCQDPLFERVLTTPWPYTRDDAEFFVKDFVPQNWANRNDCTWGIRNEDRALLGMISWRSRGDVGFWMGTEHRGRGYTLEALRTVCEWVFVDAGTGLGAETVLWETVLGNIASARVARAAGFLYTGSGPAMVPSRDGSLRDSWHGVLRRDDDRNIKDGWPL